MPNLVLIIRNRQVRLVTVDNRNGAEAMKLIEQNMDEPCDIKLYSDINTASSTTFEARNVLNCIAGNKVLYFNTGAEK